MEMSRQPQPAQQSQLQQRRLAVHRPTRLRSQSTPTSDGWVMPTTTTAEGDQADAMHMADDNHQHQHQHYQQQQQHRQPQHQRHENGGQKGKMDIGFLVSN
jgi:hypothetical protein